MRNTWVWENAYTPKRRREIVLVNLFKKTRLTQGAKEEYATEQHRGIILYKLEHWERDDVKKKNKISL